MSKVIIFHNMATNNKIANMPQGGRTDITPSANLHKVSQPKAASMLNVSPRTVATVKAVEKEAPELLEKMVNYSEITVIMLPHFC